MGHKIRQLDSLTIDRIAAGEVLETPFSCVKELIDNAIDAGATAITIDIIGGGQDRIQVIDNGFGMSQEDLALSICRHTTSKISSFDDIETISTLGFRGEALASIVAVSKTTIISAQHGDSPVVDGMSLIAFDGKIELMQPCKAIPGTTVIVEGLFLSLPARRKFLKAPSKDTQEILRGVKFLALASSHVAFTLIADGKKIFSIEGQSGEGDFIVRAKSIYSDFFNENAHPICFEQDDFSLKGILASSTSARTQKNGQFLVVNGRPVQSNIVSYAIRAAFGSEIEQGKHPLFALKLAVRQTDIDVNVHPQKKEIRFVDEGSVRSMVYNAAVAGIYGNSFVQATNNFPIHHQYSFEESVQESNAPQSFSMPWDSGNTWVQHEFIEPKVRCLGVFGDIALFTKETDSVIFFDVRGALLAMMEQSAPNHLPCITIVRLLLPIVLSVTMAEAYEIQEKNSLLSQFGFLLHQSGETAFLVEEIPGNLDENEVKQCLLDLIHQEVSSKVMGTESKKKWVTTYMRYMKELRHPISNNFAELVYGLWNSYVQEQKIVDAGGCCFLITPDVMKKFLQNEVVV